MFDCLAYEKWLENKERIRFDETIKTKLPGEIQDILIKHGLPRWVIGFYFFTYEKGALKPLTKYFTKGLGTYEEELYEEKKNILKEYTILFLHLGNAVCYHKDGHIYQVDAYDLEIDFMCNSFEELLLFVRLYGQLIELVSKEGEHISEKNLSIAQIEETREKMKTAAELSWDNYGVWERMLNFLRDNSYENEKNAEGKAMTDEKFTNNQSNGSKEQDINIYISGMGIVFHSGGILKEVKEGQNFFQTDFNQPEQVVAHIKKGDIVGFCTGSGGDYTLKFREGYPDSDIVKRYPMGARLAIIIDDGKLYIKDLFELMDWSSDCENILELENGVYHITLCTQVPKSGIYGDDQEIYVYLQELDEMPLLAWEGVPQLCE